MCTDIHKVCGTLERFRVLCFCYRDHRKRKNVVLTQPRQIINDGRKPSPGDLLLVSRHWVCFTQEPDLLLAQMLTSYEDDIMRFFLHMSQHSLHVAQRWADGGPQEEAGGGGQAWHLVPATDGYEKGKLKNIFNKPLAPSPIMCQGGRTWIVFINRLFGSLRNCERFTAMFCRGKTCRPRLNHHGTIGTFHLFFQTIFGSQKSYLSGWSVDNCRPTWRHFACFGEFEF